MALNPGAQFTARMEVLNYVMAYFYMGRLLTSGVRQKNLDNPTGH